MCLPEGATCWSTSSPAFTLLAGPDVLIPAWYQIQSAPTRVNLHASEVSADLTNNPGFGVLARISTRASDFI